MHLLVLWVVTRSQLVRVYDYLYRHFIKPLPLPMFLRVIVCLLVAYFTGSQLGAYSVFHLLFLTYCNSPGIAIPIATAQWPLSIFRTSTCISSCWRTCATRVITTNVLQTKVDAKCDKLAIKLSSQRLQLVKVTNITLPHLHLAPPSAWTHLSFPRSEN